MTVSDLAAGDGALVRVRTTPLPDALDLYRVELRWTVDGVEVDRTGLLLQATHDRPRLETSQGSLAYHLKSVRGARGLGPGPDSIPSRVVAAADDPVADADGMVRRLETLGVPARQHLLAREGRGPRSGRPMRRYLRPTRATGADAARGGSLSAFPAIQVTGPEGDRSFTAVDGEGRSGTPEELADLVVSAWLPWRYADTLGLVPEEDRPVRFSTTDRDPGAWWGVPGDPDAAGAVPAAPRDGLTAADATLELADAKGEYSWGATLTLVVGEQRHALGEVRLHSREDWEDDVPQIPSWVPADVAIHRPYGLAEGYEEAVRQALAEREPAGAAAVQVGLPLPRPAPGDEPSGRGFDLRDVLDGFLGNFR